MVLGLTTFQKYQRELITKKYAIQGYGATKTLRKLQEMGLGQRKTDFLRIYREYSGIPVREEVIKYTPKQLGISRGSYTESEGFMRKRYRYTIRTRFRDIITGETKEYFTNVITDIEKTIWQVEQEAGQAIDVMIQYGTYHLEDRHVVAAYHRQGDEWQ